MHSKIYTPRKTKTTDNMGQGSKEEEKEEANNRKLMGFRGGGEEMCMP